MDCKFQLFCKNELCQFQHSHSKEQLDDINIINDDDSLTIDFENVSAKDSRETNVTDIAQNGINNDGENDSDSEPEECDTCDKIFKSNSDLNEHHTNDNCGFGCTECGDYFRYENDLKIHQNKICT